MADTSSSQSKVEEFCKVSGVDPGRAESYLEAAAWNLDLALSSFFEEVDEDLENNSSQVAKDPLHPAPSVFAPRFGTLASLIQDSANDEEEGQAFYAGGSERSGQQVLGPGKRKAGPEIVEEMFKAAKGHGAHVVEINDSRQGKASSSSAFGGTGYKLGTTQEDTEVVSDNRQRPKQSIDITLKMWSNGFSTDSGPLREYTDPANKQFLNSIRRGEIPQELLTHYRGQEVNLNMEDHRTEEFTATRVATSAFSGAGHRLGSPAPAVLGISSAANFQGDIAQCEEAAKKLLQVNESNSTTNIQVRLTDGSRLVITMNHDHTVGDIRRYIVAARPEYATNIFALMTMYPSKELDDDSISVKDANLLNAVIVQKLK